jgi:hypothetical protein
VLWADESVRISDSDPNRPPTSADIGSAGHWLGRFGVRAGVRLRVEFRRASLEQDNTCAKSTAMTGPILDEQADVLKP